jgi:hypothetical protein
MTVIGDADEIHAAAGRGNGDAARAGIDGVLDQFLDDAGGALDHFASGNAVDQVFG